MLTVQKFCQCGVGDPAAELAAVERMVRSDPSGRTPLCQQISQVCATLHPTPYNLNPTPYTLHPTPYTLQPKPSTLHHTPYTLHPTHYTLHTTPYPTPYTGCGACEGRGGTAENGGQKVRGSSGL